jgi:hypothetical protein
MFFSRRPHRYYNEVDGILIPIEPIMMNQMQGNYPPQGGHGNPYGSQYPYQPPGYIPPQGPYNSYNNPGQHSNNAYGNNPYSSNQYSYGGSANNIYNPSNFQANSGQNILS